MANCTSWVQPFWTYVYTVHDAPATEYAEWVIKISETILRSCITAIGKETICL